MRKHQAFERFPFARTETILDHCWATEASATRRSRRLCLKHRVLMVVLFVMMLAGGIVAFRELNIEAYPDPTPPMVDVDHAKSGSLGRGDRALHHHPDRDPDRRRRDLALDPHHLAVRSVRREAAVLVRPDLRRRRCSRCSTGLSQVAPLPNNAQPRISPVSPIGEIYRYRLAGRRSYSVLDLKTLAGLGAAAPLPRGARRRSTSSAGAARPRRSSSRSISTSSSPTA